jgi:flagellar motor switch protein FliM
MRVEGRPYTTIERTLVQRLLNVVLADISTAFAPLAKVHFEFDRLEVNPRFAMITRHANACILARLRVEMEDRGGKIEILMPYASLEPVREVLLQQFMGEKFGRDSIWETHLAQELRHTDVALDVVLHQQLMPLSTILDLKIGDRLVLDSKPNAPVSLQCGQVPLFIAELGQVEGRPSVRIADTMLPGGVAA